MVLNSHQIEEFLTELHFDALINHLEICSHQSKTG